MEAAYVKDAERHRAGKAEQKQHVVGLCLNTLAGAFVVMACRNVNAANEIAEKWRADAHRSTLNVKVNN